MAGAQTAGTRVGRTAPFANAPVYFVAIALSAVVLVPIAYVVLSGFRTTGQLAAKPVGLPHPWVIHNYAEVITSDVANADDLIRRFKQEDLPMVAVSVGMLKCVDDELHIGQGFGQGVDDTIAVARTVAHTP